MVLNPIKFLILIKPVSAINASLEGPISHRQVKKKKASGFKAAKDYILCNFSTIEQ